MAVNGLTATAITTTALAALSGGELGVGMIADFEYDGTQFQVMAETPVAITVGTIMAWPTSTVPSGWLECYGQAISRTTYSALFNVLSTSYGIGNGSTTFNLPDMRGRVIAGEDDMGGASANRLTGVTGSVDGDGLGNTGGEETHTLVTAELASHTHVVSGNTGPTADFDHTHAFAYNTTSATFNAGGGGTSVVQSLGTNNGSGTTGGYTGSTTTHLHAVSITSAAAGSGSAHNNVQPTIILKWIILALPAATIPVGSGNTVSPRLCHTGGIPAQVSTDGTDSTPSVTETYICEVFIAASTTVTPASNSLLPPRKKPFSKRRPRTTNVSSC